jgi:TRAP-type uncharacterized transport system fused permease subunit
VCLCNNSDNSTRCCVTSGCGIAQKAAEQCKLDLKEILGYCAEGVAAKGKAVHALLYCLLITVPLLSHYYMVLACDNYEYRTTASHSTAMTATTVLQLLLLLLLRRQPKQHCKEQLHRTVI